MRLIAAVTLIVLGCCLGTSVGATPPPTTRPAKKLTDVEAKQVYDAALKAAADSYKAAVARADQQYGDNLTAALDAAMQRGVAGFDDAKRIDAERQAAAALTKEHQNSAPPSAAQPPAQVYLSDMGPILAQTFADGSWGFGANGYLGNVDFDRIEVRGRYAIHGLGAQPQSGGSSRIVYELNKQFSTLSGSAAIADTGKAPRTAIVFHIAADGRELWRSSSVSRPGTPVDFKVDVTGVTRLELIADCPGPNGDDHAVWVDPVLTRSHP